MITESNLTGAIYHDEDMVFFRNPLQSAFYVFSGAKLVDLFVDDKLRFVFVFSKIDHEKLKLKWKLRNKDVENKNDG